MFGSVGSVVKEITGPEKRVIDVMPRLWRVKQKIMEMMKFAAL